MMDLMKTGLDDVQQNLTATQQNMKVYADQSRRDKAFQVGMEVVLNTRNLQQLDKHLLVKHKRWVGRFKVAKVVSTMAYQLSLTPGWKIWPIFLVSNFKQFMQSIEFVWAGQPLPPILVDSEKE